MKVKPSMKIKIRVLITYEKLSLNLEGNAYYEIAQHWVYNTNARKSG